MQIKSVIFGQSQPQTIKSQAAAKLSSFTRPDQVRFGREREWILPEDREGALFSSSSSGDIEVLKDLLEYVKKGQFKINGRADSAGWAPVHNAAGYGHLEWLKLAHEKGGADLWVKSNDGTLPIDLAREEGHQDIVAYLESQQQKGTPNPSEKKKGTQQVSPKKFFTRFRQWFSRCFAFFSRRFGGSNT